MSDEAVLAELKALWEKNWPTETPREPQYPLGEIPLTDYLRTWTRRQPEVPAFIYYGAETSYAELDRLSDAFA